MYSFITILCIFIVLLPWIKINQTLSSGDWPYLFLENIKEFSFFSYDSRWLIPYYHISSKLLVQYLGLQWELVEKLLWFWPFIIFSVVSSYYLTKSWIGVLIYTTNTYVLMVVGGGQMGVALAYSLAPLVLARFIKLIDLFSSSSFNFKVHPFGKSSTPRLRLEELRTGISNFKFSIIAGLILAVQVMFDPRIAYVTIIAIFLYWLIIFLKSNQKQKNILRVIAVFFIPIFIVAIINLYWMIPLYLKGTQAEVLDYGNPEGFKYYSFADFSHTLSLLHPNWPDNVFGKTYFLKPEFLILPILAYIALLYLGAASLSPRGWNSFVPRENRVLFFAVLGLVGAFLAKGANEPIGQVNQFLFQYLPGMRMFRDPTKFYTLIALSYSVLIPFSLEQAFEKVSGIRYKALRDSSKFVGLAFVFFWVVTIHPAISGSLGGTFKPRAVPYEYIQFKEFIKTQEDFSKTLWVPTRQRFGFSSKKHLALSADEIFQSVSPNGIIDILKGKNKHTKDPKKYLIARGVKYVIVPFDSREEIFTEDRKYSKQVREYFLSELNSIDYLIFIKQFGEILIYQIAPNKLLRNDAK